MVKVKIKPEFVQGLRISNRVLVIALLMIVLHVSGPGITEGMDEIRAQAPCYNCHLYDAMQHDEPIYQEQVISQCNYPCKCSNRENRCKGGVNTVKDNCDCCYMCARQQGDLCNYRDKCDEDKGLYCDFQMGDGSTGICRANAAKPCEVDGQVYKDGEEFKPSCNRLCSCQNGNYACTSFCPQEEHRPSSVHCKEPQLVAITGRCCKEWVCPHSNSLPHTKDEFMPATTNQPEPCIYESSKWSACSASCGMGVSIRITNNNDQCQPVEQKRLCYVRPCEADDKHVSGRDCKSTWKDELHHLEHRGCKSTEQFKLKFCSTCKKHKCCGPDKTRTMTVKFSCEASSHVEVEQFMWIQTCECYPKRRCPFT